MLVVHLLLQRPLFLISSFLAVGHCEWALRICGAAACLEGQECAARQRTCGPRKQHVGGQTELSGLPQDAEHHDAARGDRIVGCREHGPANQRLNQQQIREHIFAVPPSQRSQGFIELGNGGGRCNGPKTVWISMKIGMVIPSGLWIVRRRGR